MAASRTKFGFAGSGGEDLESRSSPTVLGHAVHLGAPGDVRDHAPSGTPGDPVAPPAPAEIGMLPAEVAGPPPSHSGKSNYPSVARLFGRWDENGKLVIDDPQVGETTIDDDDDRLVVARERLFPRWMLVVIALAVGLAVTAFALHRQRPAPPARVGIGSLPANRAVAVFPMDFLAHGRMP